MGGVFIEYDNFKHKYTEIQSKYNEILTEKENLFTRTQPNAIRYDKLQIEGGKLRENGFDEYLAECEKRNIDRRLNEGISLLRARAELLRLKEIDLRASKDINDIIYTMKFLDNAKPKTIAMALGYSESQVYRLIQKIQERIAR